MNARYPDEPFDGHIERRSATIRGNPGAGRCYDVVFHAQLVLPKRKIPEKVVIVSVWEVGYVPQK